MFVTISFNNNNNTKYANQSMKEEATKMCRNQK